MAYYQGRGGFLSNIPIVTKNILLINFFVFIFWLLRPEFMTQTFALFYPMSDFFHFWQPVTYMFMHGGWLHIFMNMFVLISFGIQLESMWGPRKFLFFYFATGIGAAALHMGVQWCESVYYLNRIDAGVNLMEAYKAVYVINNTPTVGASGAIYGLLMGFAMLFPDARLTLIFPPISLKSKWWAIIWIAMELLLGVSGSDGVAHFAHLGGMLFGFLIIMYWKKKGKMYDYES